MKTFLKIISITVVAAALFQLTPAGAQDWQNKLYGKFDAGGSWVHDTDVKEVFGTSVPGDRMKFEPGFRAGIGVGYEVTDWFAGELEMGLLANGVKDIMAASSVEADLFNVPFLVNARVQWPNRSIFTPYLGGGVGGAGATLDISQLDYGTSHIWGTASDFVFACQAFAGVRVALNENMSLGVEYRYVHTSAPDFEIDWGGFWNISSEHMRLGPLDTQSVSLTFQIRF